MRIVTKNAVRDFVRKKLGPGRKAQTSRAANGLLNEFASSPLLEELGVRPPLTSAQTARELLEFARARLATPELRILAAWLEGSSFDEIANDERLSPDAALKVVRAAIATLRRHFAPATKTEE